MSKTKYLPPTWEGTIRMFVEAYRNSGDSKHLTEIIRCARFADKYLAIHARVECDDKPIKFQELLKLIRS